MGSLAHHVKRLTGLFLSNQMGKQKTRRFLFSSLLSPLLHLSLLSLYAFFLFFRATTTALAAPPRPRTQLPACYFLLTVSRLGGVSPALSARSGEPIRGHSTRPFSRETLCGSSSQMLTHSRHWHHRTWSATLHVGNPLSSAANLPSLADPSSSTPDPEPSPSTAPVSHPTVCSQRGILPLPEAGCDGTRRMPRVRCDGQENATLITSRGYNN